MILDSSIVSLLYFISGDTNGALYTNKPPLDPQRNPLTRSVKSNFWLRWKLSTEDLLTLECQILNEHLLLYNVFVTEVISGAVDLGLRYVGYSLTIGEAYSFVPR